MKLADLLIKRCCLTLTILVVLGLISLFPSGTQSKKSVHRVGSSGLVFAIHTVSFMFSSSNPHTFRNAISLPSPLSLHLVLLAPINSCSLFSVFFLPCISLFLLYSSSGLSTDVFHIQKNIGLVHTTLSSVLGASHIAAMGTNKLCTPSLPSLNMFVLVLLWPYLHRSRSTEWKSSTVVYLNR